MNYAKYIFIFIAFSLFAQEKIPVKQISKSKYIDQKTVQIDEFGTQYSFNYNTFYSKGTKGNFEYTNIQLGDITSANVFNPLKIYIFYKDFNTVVILDNRLAEIKKIDFNTLNPFRIISKISPANDNNIWIFNENTQQLELFDFINNKTKHTTLPIEGNVLDLESNYNFCWLLTDTFIYTYNYFGSLISKQANNGFEQLRETNGNLILKSNNSLFFLSKKANEITELDLPKLLIKRFFVTNETLYIYDDEFLHQYQLINE